MAGSADSISEKIEKVAMPIAENLDLTIWDVQYVKEGADWYLRVFIDSDLPVTIEDCERMSRALDKPLDELDIIPNSYCLEVSSPGVERKLTKPEHFNRFLNENVMVKTIRPNEDGKREFWGILKDFNNGNVTIQMDNCNLLNTNIKDLAYVKLDDFN